MASLSPSQNPASAASQGVAEPVAKPSPYRSLRLLTRLVQGQYWLLSALSLVTAVVAVQGWLTAIEMQSLKGARKAYWPSPQVNFNTRQLENLQVDLQIYLEILEVTSGLPVLLLGLLLLATIVLWVYLAAANLPALGTDVDNQSPLVAAVTLAIPLVNALAAIRVLGQIACASDPLSESIYGRGDSFSLVMLWWVANLITVASGIYANTFLGPNIRSPEELKFYLLVLSAVAGFSIVPFSLAVFMFGSIAANQEIRWNNLNRP